MAEYDWTNYHSCCGTGPHGIWCIHKMTRDEWDEKIIESFIPNTIPNIGTCPACYALVSNEHHLKHWIEKHNHRPIPGIR